MTTRKSATKQKVKIVEARDPATQFGVLTLLGGSRCDDWNNALSNQAINSLWLAHSDENGRDKHISATLAALMSIAPKDELESMIAAQLLAAHNAAMECFRRAMLSEQTFAGRDQNLAFANKLSRTFATLLETLNRHRGKGQQRVTVEHVHVHSGGQAVVGVVQAPVGQEPLRAGEPPDAISYAQGVPVPRADESRERVPVTGNDERAVSHARRHVTGRSEGQ